MKEGTAAAAAAYLIVILIATILIPEKSKWVKAQPVKITDNEGCKFCSETPRMDILLYRSEQGPRDNTLPRGENLRVLL
jgi:hypothetical protein